MIFKDKNHYQYIIDSDLINGVAIDVHITLASAIMECWGNERDVVTIHKVKDNKICSSKKYDVDQYMKTINRMHELAGKIFNNRVDYLL